EEQPDREVGGGAQDALGVEVDHEGIVARPAVEGDGTVRSEDEGALRYAVDGDLEERGDVVARGDDGTDDKDVVDLTAWEEPDGGDADGGRLAAALVADRHADR